jgi:hypothetical protein
VDNEAPQGLPAIPPAKPADCVDFRMLHLYIAIATIIRTVHIRAIISTLSSTGRDKFITDFDLGAFDTALLGIALASFTGIEPFLQYCSHYLRIPIQPHLIMFSL